MAGGTVLLQQLHAPSGEREGEANGRPYGTGENAHPCDAGENIRRHGTGGTVRPQVVLPQLGLAPFWNYAIFG